MSIRSPIVVAVLGAALLAPDPSAQSFTRVIGSGDPVPGGAQPIFSFPEAPCLEGDHIAFLAGYQDASGSVQTVYSNAGGSFAPVVSTGDPMPTEGVPFEFLIRLAADEDSIAVQGSSFVGGISRNGIYANKTGALTELVDENDFIPQGFGQFTQIAGQDFTYDGGLAVFNGSGSSAQRGLYAVDAVTGTLERIVDSSMQVPGQAPGVTYTTFSEAGLHNERVVFGGNFGGGSGVYERVGMGLAAGPVGTVADTATPVPGGGSWWLVTAPAISEGVTLFQGYGPSVGLFRADGGVLEVVADGSTAIPGGTGTFPEFNARALSQGRPVFEGYDYNFGGHLGVFTDWCGSLQPILAPGDVLDGLTVQLVRFDEDSVDDGRMAALVVFTDGSSAIYLIAFDTMSSYGSGHAGSSAVAPSLTAVGCPALDVDIELRLRDGPPAAAGFLVVGLAPESAAIPSGGTLLARPDVIAPITLDLPAPGIPGGWLDLVEHIPADPVLSGQTFHAQGAFADGLVPGGWILTAGLAVPVP